MAGVGKGNDDVPMTGLPAYGRRELPAGCTLIPEGQSIFDALKQSKLMVGKSNCCCCGHVVNGDELGVYLKYGEPRFLPPGQYNLWEIGAEWHGVYLIAQPLIRVPGCYILNLSQSQYAVVKGSGGGTTLVGAGQYLVRAPATVIGDVVDTMNLGAPSVAVDRFLFLNVSPGDVAATVDANAERKPDSNAIHIFPDGVHIATDMRLDRFVAVRDKQDNLEMDVLSQDQATVKIKVDITTAVTNPALFVSKSGGAEGYKSLYDALDETAKATFIELFGRVNYHQQRGTGDDLETRLEETARERLQEVATNIGGRVVKVNIIYYRADQVERQYAEHSANLLTLEHKNQSQQRAFEGEAELQRHQHEMAMKTERAEAEKQELRHEREMRDLNHAEAIKKAQVEAEAERRRIETEAEASRQKTIANAGADALAAQERAKRDAEVLLIKERARAELEAIEGIKTILGDKTTGEYILALQRQRHEADVARLRNQGLADAVKGGATIIPAELNLLAADAARVYEEQVRNALRYNVVRSAAAGELGIMTPAPPGVVRRTVN